MRNIIGAVILLLSITSIAAAKESTTSITKTKKLYATLDIGRSTYKDSCLNSTGNCSESGIAYRFGVGYQYSPTWGIEANYRMSGGPSSSQGGFTTEMKPTALQVSVTGMYPFAKATSFIGKLGVVRTNATYLVNGSSSSFVSPTTTKLAYGIGAQYDFSNILGARIQYEGLGEVGGLSVSKVSGFPVSMISAGLVYKF